MAKIKMMRGDASYYNKTSGTEPEEERRPICS